MSAPEEAQAGIGEAKHGRRPSQKKPLGAPVLREPRQWVERIPGVIQRQKHDTRIGNASYWSRRSAQMWQAQWHGRNGCGGHELTTATVRAAHVLVALDALHEVLDRLHHNRVGCWR